MSPAHRFMARRLVALAAALLLAGCAAQSMHSDGLQQLNEGKVAQGLQNLRKASEMDPGNARYRIDFLTQRELATQAVLRRADEARTAGRVDEAIQRYREALQLDEGSERAQRGLMQLDDQRKGEAAIQQAERMLKAGQTDPARDVLRRAQKDLPGNAAVAAQLKALDERLEGERAGRERAQLAQSAFRKPVTLQFRDANLKMVFEALSRTANVNIILDRDVKSDLKTTIYVKDASVEDTIDLILLQNQLEKRVLNQNTLFVYPAVAAKQKEYNELKVRSFQLSNIEAAHVANIIKSLLKTKDIVTDARTNTLVMRDTADAIAVAEKLVAANDVPDPEVMLEVQVLEVSVDRMSNLGIKWPDAFSVATPANARTIGDLKALTRNDLVTSQLGVALNLMLQDTETNILASPRIRTRNKEKARILVGDKVPVITNLITPQQAGQSSVITGSIQYIDVGIKLEVEPQVYADGDVGIKINLEVSNIAKTITTDSGQAYQIGTRSAQTSLRLKDGETQVLAGLINDQDRSTASKVPGLGQVPVAGRLFSSNNGNATKSEIVLSITPRIIRPQTLPEARNGDVWSGTENIVREKPLRLDPIGAARSGNAADMPALAPSNGAAGSAAAAAQPATGPKAGGAGGSTILNAGRPPMELSTPPAGGAAPAGAGGATAAGQGTGTVTAATTGAGSGSSGLPLVGGVGSSPPPGTNQRRPAPASVQPGRAMAPASPSAPAGTAPPPPPPVAPDEG
ncbi:MAG TPA: secretin N-terminal domain-containing protein [Piscinibacter sp.]|nr:secretin N-terminal domain-containing protein [Piscinibacter sp.]HNW61529.1 secretin N-terminal domain-containing protein [Piscinibacter sp.]